MRETCVSQILRNIAIFTNSYNHAVKSFLVILNHQQWLMKC